MGLSAMPEFLSWGPHPDRSASAPVASMLAKMKVFFKSSSRAEKTTRHNTTTVDKLDAMEEERNEGLRHKAAQGDQGYALRGADYWEKESLLNVYSSFALMSVPGAWLAGPRR